MLRPYSLVAEQERGKVPDVEIWTMNADGRADPRGTRQDTPPFQIATVLVKMPEPGIEMAIVYAPRSETP